MFIKFALLLSVVALASATVYFKETFPDEASFKDEWIVSKHKSDYGPWKWTAGKFYGDKDADAGIQTGQDARFYSAAKKFDKSFSNKDKTLVIQFSVKHEQNIDCGGGYVKVLPGSADLEDFHGETKYNIMFGEFILNAGDPVFRETRTEH